MKNAFLLLIAYSLSLPAQTSKAALNKNGITIYTSKKDNSRIKQYEANMTVNAPLDSVKNILLNFNQLKTWNYKTSVSRLIKKVNDTTFIVYMVNHLGWPLQDRDNVARVSVSNKKDMVRIDICPEKNILKPQKGIIRVENFKGYWILKRTNNKSTKITQSFYADIDGNIPVWLINSLVTQAPYETFKALRKRVENVSK